MTELEKCDYIRNNYPKLTLQEIAKELKWSSKDPVRLRLKKLGISINNRGASQTTRNSSLSQIQHEILEGWIMSDGHLEKTKTSVTPFFTLALIEQQAIEFTNQNLPLSWSDIVIKNNTIDPRGWKNQTLYKLRSHSDLCLIPYYDRWYCGKDKHIPKDFVLTPTIMRFCIYGDGTRQSKNSTESLVLCLESFNQKDKERLVKLFYKNIGINLHINGRGRPFICNKNQINKFLDWLGTPELSCFDYKFIRSTKNGHRINQTICN